MGGDLTVESLQDENSSKSVTLGVSGGVNSGGANAGANFNLSKTESDWVNEQTSLTGDGKVTIDVEDKTTLKGAVIASTTGDLTLETGSLEYSNIKDKDKSYNIGGGGNYGVSETNNGNKTNYSANANYEFSDKKQTNFATIGEGTIIVKDSETDLTDLKRDITLAQYNTKEGGLKGGFTVDNTTVDFLTDIDGTIINTAKAVEKGSLISYSIGEGAVKATVLGMEKDLGVEGTIKAIQNSYNDVSTIVSIADNKQLAKKIDGALNYDAATFEGAVNEVSTKLQIADGATDGEISHVTLYQGNETDNKMSGYAAAYDQNTNTTYLNTQGTDISQGGDIINSIFTEEQRRDTFVSGLTLDKGQQQDLAYFRGEQAEVLWNRFSDTATTNTNYGGIINWNNANAGSNTLISGSSKADALDTSEGNGVVPRIAENSMFLSDNEGNGGGGEEGYYKKQFDKSLHNEDGSEKPLLTVINKSNNAEENLNKMYDAFTETDIKGKSQYIQIDLSDGAVSELNKVRSDCWKDVAIKTIAGSTLGGPLGTVVGYASSDIAQVLLTGNNGYKEVGAADVGWHINIDKNEDKNTFNIHVDVHNVTTKNPVVIYEHIKNEYIPTLINNQQNNDWMQTPSNEKILENFDWMTP